MGFFPLQITVESWVKVHDRQVNLKLSKANRKDFLNICGLGTQSCEQVFTFL